MNSCSYDISFDNLKQSLFLSSFSSNILNSLNYLYLLDSRVLLECIFLDVLFYLGRDEKLPKVLMLNPLYSYALSLPLSVSVLFSFLLISHNSFSLIWVNCLRLCMYLVRAIALVYLSHVSGQVSLITIYT